MKFVYILSVLFPVLGALSFGFPQVRNKWKYSTYVVCFGESLLTILIAAAPKTEIVMFRLLNLPFTLRGDGVGCFFAVFFSLLFFITALYSSIYMDREYKCIEWSIIYILTLSTLVGLSYSGNLQTYYMFFKFLTVVSFALILDDLRERSRKAALKYLYYSFMGAGLVLFGLACGYYFLGTTEFVPGGHPVPEHFTWCALMVAFITVMGFGCKAGIMPLHAWLPTAHPQAPAPASAVLSGCVTKAGLLGILRVIYYMYGTGFLRGTWVQSALIGIALITIFCGSMLAYKERVLKKRLAYSTVSQVSYALFGLFLMSNQGFTGAMLQVLFHGVTKVSLFLCAGCIIHHTHIETISDREGNFSYYGLGKSMPVTMIAYTLASLSLVGLPPFGGFVSKWYLAEGSFEALGAAGWVGAAVLLISALLTAGYLLSITSKAFFPTREDVLCKAHEAGWEMTVPVLLLSALLLILGISTFGLSNIFAAIAAAVV